MDLVVDPKQTSIEIADSTGPIENFIFFWWFDYLGAFLLIVWVRVAQECLNNGQFPKSKTELLLLVHQPLLFWIAPSLPPTYDRRKLLLSRPSPKIGYIVMLVMGTTCLHLIYKIRLKKVFITICTGLAVACIHHLALFTYGMRGYDTIQALMITLLTEWPALIVAEHTIRVVFRNLPSKLSKYARHSLLLIFVSIVVRNIEIEQIDRVLLPLIPGDLMQSFGTAAFRLSTCSIPEFLRPAPLRCREFKDDDSILVIATPAKSGALLSAKILFDVGSSCHFCVASGERSRAGIPGPIEDLPTYEGEMLHAIINMRNWDEYVMDKPYRCATIIRDPIARLRSLYLYARAGGEAWFRRDSGLMQALRVKNLNDSLNLYWQRFGRAYIEQAHEYDRFNIETQGCDVYRLEEFKEDYDDTMRRLLGETWKFNDDAVQTLVQKLRRHDVSRVLDSSIKSNLLSDQLERARNPHVSSTNYSPEFIRSVVLGLESIDEVIRVVEKQRKAVPYSM